MLQNYPESLSGEEIKNKICDYHSWLLEKSCYDRQGAVTPQAKADLVANCNLSALQEDNPVRWAVTVRRANLRNLPSNKLWTDEPGFFLLDLLQGTAVDPGEPLAILHTSADGKMFFAEMRYYCGWIDRADVAMASREEMLSYARPNNFLVVTTNKITVAGRLYQLGAVLPLLGREQKGWLVQVPDRDGQGRLQSQAAPVEKSPALHQGWLEPTRENLSKMAFTCLEDKYDWGGMTDSVDCSSLVANAYRTVGMELPRDADEQEAAAKVSIKFTGGAEERLATLRQAQLGDLLFRDGHVMLYLGEKAGRPEMLHAYSRCRERGEIKAPRRVAVTEVDYTLVTGESNLLALTSIGKFIE